MKKNIYKIIALSLLLTPGGAAAEDARTRLVGDGWFEMPFRPSQQNPQGEYIYFVGGYNSEDRGTPPWGSLVESENLFIGDRAGEIVIAYADGTADVIPLIFGYTMWFKANWRDGGAPFKTEEAEPAMTACLRKALQLQGGFEGNDQTAIKVKIQSKPIREIRLADNPRKAGEPVFDGGYLLRSDERKTLSGGKPVDAADPFFDTHTIDSRRPDTMRREIERIRRRLYTFESDFKKAPAFKYPETYERARISFTGNRFADILTQVYYYNVEDILTKMRDDGMIDESSPGAPSWRYDGFGTWVPQANSYCGAMYSRNRALGILSYLDLLPKTQKSVDFLHKCLMYYPDNGLTMLGKRIPGHWSVIPNKPMEYSKVLVPVANWPTQYTKELFGDDYQNFGNQPYDAALAHEFRVPVDSIPTLPMSDRKIIARRAAMCLTRECKVVNFGIGIPETVIAVLNEEGQDHLFTPIIESGAIGGIDPGQIEGGQAVGMSYGQIMLHVIMPQAFKNILPALGNEFIALIKETSVVSFVGATDLYVAFNNIGSNSYEFMVPYLVMALIYIALVMIISAGIKLMERSLRKSDRSR